MKTHFYFLLVDSFRIKSTEWQKIKNQLALILLILYSGFLISCKRDVNQEKLLSLNLEYGKYDIGLIDTTIFSKNESYQYETYEGPKPYFVKIWYPAKNNRYSKLTFKEYFKPCTDSSLFGLSQSLNLNYLENLMEYGILRNIGRGDKPIRTAKEDSMYFDLLQKKTMAAHQVNRAEGKFPVVIYHHGYEGWSYDNFLLLEYLASYGYLVIASNFEWPGVNNEFYQGNHDIDFLLDFASTLNSSDTSRIYAIGHSWGAQSFLYYDKLDHKPFKAIFSLHTTLEHSKIEDIPTSWPEVYMAITDSTRAFTSTYVFAPEKPSNDFWVFRKSTSENFTYINALQPITHEGFISLENFRYFLKNVYKFSDDSLLVKQFETYQEINRYILHKLSDTPVGEAAYSRIFEVK
jgi:pimeloyl-ACP methyl ester carboxylesterase